MIIYRAFAREAAGNALAVTFTLVTVTAFISVTVLLGRVAQGDVAKDVVLQILGLETLKRLDLLMVLGVYLGVLLAASRWYRDNEMTVLAACGIGLPQLLRRMLIPIALVAMVIATLSSYFTPWAAARMERVKAEREQQLQLAAISPGLFNEISGRTRIFYAERIDHINGTLGNVFVSSLDPEKPAVVMARGGSQYLDADTGDRFLTLLDGNLYEGTPGEAGYRVLNFNALHLRVVPRRVEVPAPKRDAMSTVELLRNETLGAKAEWHWRLAKPIMAAVLVLFALVLAYTDPRSGRLMNLFVAILVYFVYSNVLALGLTLIKKGLVPAPAGLWWVHAAMLVLGLYLFRQRAMDRPLLAPWRRRRG